MNKHLLSLACGLVAALLPAQEAKNADASKVRSAANAAFDGRDWDTAIAGYRKLTELDAKDEEAWFKLGYCLHNAKKLDEALPVHLKAAAFPRYAPVASYNVACVYSLKGDKDKAFEWLDKAVTAGWNRVEDTTGDTDMDPIRKDPRFEKVIAKMKDGAARGGGRLMVYAQPPQQRRGVRIALFSQSGSPGQVAIDYAVLDWKDSMEEAINSPKMAGKKWRFGKDFWTNLDTSMNVEIAGTAIPAGYYYLTLEKRTGEAGDQYILGVHDAAEVRKQKLDAFVADRLKGGIEVKLDYKKSETIAKQLEITLDMEKDSQDTGSLQVRFGPHALSAPLKLKLK